MATATIVKAWESPDGQTAYAAALVAEGVVNGVNVGNVEYIASTPTHDSLGNALAGAQIKTNLTAALSAARAAQLGTNTALAISGTVTV